MKTNILNPNSPGLSSIRGTGRTTAIALETLSIAISKHGRTIKIEDHIPDFKNHRQLMYQMIEIVKKLELKGFVFYHHDLTVRCDIFQEVL